MSVKFDESDQSREKGPQQDCRGANNNGDKDNRGAQGTRATRTKQRAYYSPRQRVTRIQSHARPLSSQMLQCIWSAVITYLQYFAARVHQNGVHAHIAERGTAPPARDIHKQVRHCQHEETCSTFNNNGITINKLLPWGNANQ